MNFKILIIWILCINIVYGIHISTNQTCTWEETFSKDKYENVRNNIEQELEKILDSWVDTNWTLVAQNIIYEINYICNEFTIIIEREYDED